MLAHQLHAHLPWKIRGRMGGARVDLVLDVFHVPRNLHLINLGTSAADRRACGVRGHLGFVGAGKRHGGACTRLVCTRGAARVCGERSLRRPISGVTRAPGLAALVCQSSRVEQ